MGRFFLFLFSFFIFPSLVLSESEIAPRSKKITIELLKRRRERIRQRIAICKDGPYKGDYSHHADICESGDSAAYNGMSCLAAVLANDEQTKKDRCSNLERSQDETGRWWRAPSLVKVDRGGASTFSRDMTRGIFAYLLAKGYFSNDPKEKKEAQLRSTHWLNWFMGPGNFRLCPENANGCEMRVNVRNHIYNTYRLIGTLPPRPTYRGPWQGSYTQQESFLRGLYGSEWYLRWGLNMEIPLLDLDRKLRHKYYPYNLKASSVVIYRAGNMNPTYSIRNKKIARVLGNAAEKIHSAVSDNPYYAFLRYGLTRSVLLKTLDRCPSTLPDVPLRFGGYRDWQWQRSPTEKAWEYGDGHDCMYLLNLMIARLEGHFNF